MRYARGLAAVMVILGWAAEASAQPGIGINFSRGRLSGSIFLGGGYGCGPIYGPRCCPPFFYGGPAFIPAPSVTIITQPRVIAPPIIINNVQPAAQPPQQGDMDLLDPIVFRPGQRNNRVPARQEMPGDDGELPGAFAGGFRPVRPEERMQAQQPAAEERADPKRPPFKERLPRAGAEALPPKEQAARQAMLGRHALAAQEYGRAAQRFQEAIRNAPDDAANYFLLAQTQFSLGKYREAVVSIHEGLRRQPDWPTSDFRPIELYGPNVADYTEHLEMLKEALKNNPRDPALLFLTAYQLWFDGHRDEARPLFKKALPLVAEPRFIDLFLDGKGGVRVVMK